MYRIFREAKQDDWQQFQLSLWNQVIISQYYYYW